MGGDLTASTRASLMPCGKLQSKPVADLAAPEDGLSTAGSQHARLTSCRRSRGDWAELSKIRGRSAAEGGAALTGMATITIDQGHRALHARCEDEARLGHTPLGAPTRSVADDVNAAPALLFD